MSRRRPEELGPCSVCGRDTKGSWCAGACGMHVCEACYIVRKDRENFECVHCRHCEEERELGP